MKKQSGDLMRCYETYYKTRFGYSKDREKVWKAIASYLQRYVAPSDTALDMGAGYCGFINNINCREKHALDISSHLNEYAAGDVRTHIGSCTGTEFKAGYFDVIFASNLFEHLNEDDLSKTFSEIGRILKNRGKLIVIQPNFKYAYKEYFDDYTHRAIFTHVSFSDFLMANGFNIIRVAPKFLPFSMKSGFPKNTLLTKLYLMSPLKINASQFLIVAEKGNRNGK